MTAVRIPIIQQRINTPSVALQGGRINAPSDQGIGQALQNVGQSAENFMQKRALVADQRKEDDAAAHSAKALSDAQAEMSRVFDAEQAASSNGAADFPARFRKIFDEHMAKVVATGGTPKAKQYLNDRLLALGTQYDERALTFSQAEGQRYRSDSYRGAADSVAAEMQTDDSNLATRLNELAAPVIADRSMLPEQKQATLDYAKNRVVLAAAQGRLIRDPYGTRDQLAVRLGIGQSTMPRTQYEEMVYIEANARAKAGQKTEDIDAWILKALSRSAHEGMVDAPEYTTKRPVSPALALLTPDQVLQFYNAADAEVQQRENAKKQAADVGRVTFQQHLTDTQAALQGGDVVPIPDLATAVQFLGPEAGQIAVDQLKVLQGMAGTMKALDAATPAETAALIKKYDPAGTGTDNREIRQQAYTAIIGQAKRVDEARRLDPIAFQKQRGMNGLGEINFADHKSVLPQLRARQLAARAFSDSYAVPFRLLDRPEAERFAAVVAQSTPAQKAGLLEKFSGALDDEAYASVIAAIAPTQPLTHSAAMYLGKSNHRVAAGTGTVTGNSVGLRILAGQELLSPPKGTAAVKLAADKDLRSSFNALAGEAYRGQADAGESAFQAFRAYYAATANDKGAVLADQVDPAIADEAFDAVSGGVATINDRAVVLPFGVGADQFTELAVSYLPRALELAGMPANTPFDRFNLALAGGDTYYWMLGDTPVPRADTGLPLLFRIAGGAPTAHAKPPTKPSFQEAFKRAQGPFGLRLP